MTLPLWLVITVCMASGYLVSMVLAARKASRVTELEDELRYAKAMNTVADTEIIKLRRQLAQSTLKNNSNNDAQQLLKLWVSYNELELKYTNLNVEYIKLRASKGTAASNTQFSQEDIKRLIRLCHPDKHNNSDAAKAITQKLLEMRR